MKKSLLTVVFVICFVITASVTYSADYRYNIDFSGTGWKNPLGGQMQTNTAFDFVDRNGTYQTLFGNQHTGIGNVVLYYTPPHFHFEINLVKNFRAGRGHGWGMLPIGYNLSANGRQNPETFLSDNSPDRFYIPGLYASDYLFADLLFDDAENKFKEYFSPRKKSQLYNGLVYRTYPNSTGGGALYIVSWKGDFWYNDGWNWRNLGSIKNIQEQVFPDCGRDPLNFPKDEGTICKDIWW